MTRSEEEICTLLKQVFEDKNVRPGSSFIRAGMNMAELPRLYRVAVENAAKEVLEIGMGNATSSIVLLQAICDNGGGSLTSVDPFQSKPREQGGFVNEGKARIEKAGFTSMHKVIEEPDYIALPSMVSRAEQFDLILVDGYHSLDYTMLDLFYADLLLRDSGVLCVHDTSWPAVYHAVRFLEQYKPYELMSPPPIICGVSKAYAGFRRLRAVVNGRYGEFVERQRNWNSLAAYRKQKYEIAPERTFNPR